MSLETQIELCSENYQKWKNLALNASDLSKSKRYLEKAFFWLELQSAFVVLWSVEKSNGKDKNTNRKLIIAKTNLSKKLADYAQQTLNEING